MRQPVADDVAGLVVGEVEQGIGDLVFLEREQDLDRLLLGFGEGLALRQPIELRGSLLRCQLPQLEQLEHELDLRRGQGLGGSGALHGNRSFSVGPGTFPWP